MSNEREQWLKERMNSIGGSDAGIILGVSPFKSKLELWTEKVEKNINTTLEDELIFQIGHALEPIIANEYFKMTGRFLESRPQKIHSNYPFISGNVDREIVSSERMLPGILEIKTKGAWTKWYDDEIPLYIIAQLQHYLSVYNYTWGSIAVLDLGTRTISYTDIERDEELIKKIIDEEKKFWDLVVSKIPPEPDSSKSCQEFLRSKYAVETVGKTIDLTQNEIANNNAYNLGCVKEDIKKLEEKEVEYKNILMSIMEDAEIGIGKDYKITWRSPKNRIVFNVDKFKEDHPEIYNRYTSSEKQTRRFVLKFND